MRRTSIVLAALAILVFAFAPTAWSATTWLVDEDRADCPRADFNSIQAAVAAAAPGDKILVCPGTYREQVMVTKSDLRLEAKGAPGAVVLDGEHALFAGFWLQDATDVLVQGFTLRGYRESAIYLERANENTIRKNVTHATGHMGSSSASRAGT